jgi:uncharacterized repeat protein (TIGR01451 family)
MLRFLTVSIVVRGISKRATVFWEIGLLGLLATVLLVSSSELTTQAQKYPPQGITGSSVDWIEASTLPSGSPERINANRVALLTNGKYRCTGFLVGPDLIMTNAHCTNDVPGTIAIFNYENGVDPSQFEAFRCDTLVRRDSLIDAALLRCQAGPIGSSTPVLPGIHRGRGFINLEDFSELSDGDDIYVIHQNCVDGSLTTPPFTNDSCIPNKKLSRGDLLRYYCPNAGNLAGDGFFFRLFHNADTLGGSSGSPIFSASTHKIVGIHRCCGLGDGTAPAEGNNATRASRLLEFVNSINLRLVDIFLIVDLSGSFADDLETFKTQAAGIVHFINGLKSIGVSPRVGLAKFEDYPIAPFGSADYGDKAYERLIDLVDPAQDSDGDGTSDILEVIQGLFTRYGGDWPQSQYAALFQAATGQGQDVNGDGDTNDVADIPPCQQANFRPNALKITMLWTDAPFHNPGDPGTIPYPGPSREATIAAQRGLTLPIFLEQGASGGEGIRVIGISSGGGGASELQYIAQATGAVAGSGGVDCDGDGSIDIPEGAPLVCGIASDGTGIGEAIESTIESIFESADLSVLKTDSPDPVNSGSNLTYTLSVANNGPGDATGVTVTDILPAGVTFVSATSSQGTCSHASGTVTCNLGTLSSGAAATITIVVIPNTPGTITNTATAVASESDPNTGNNTATAETTVSVAGPPNDNFANAQVVAGNMGSVTGSNIGATKEPCEPNHYGIPGGASVWYRWTAPIGGNATFDTFGSNFDTVLAVYTGNNLCSLTHIASSDDDPLGGLQSRVSFNAVAGTTYHIAVDGFGGFSSPGAASASKGKISTAAVAMGDIVLNWSMCPGVTVTSSPKKVTYKPTPTRPSKKTITVRVVNKSGGTRVVTNIVPLLEEPFIVTSIRPTLPKAIPNRRTQSFTVYTEVPAGWPPVTATQPYFVTVLDCGAFTTASEPQLLVPLQVHDVQLESQGGQVRVEATGVGIASVRLQLYDLAGRLMLNKESQGDTLTLPFKTLQGRALANGVYLYVVRVRGFDGQEYVSAVRKLVIVR